MYVDPMTIYREYTQNAADAIDEARHDGSLPRTTPGRVDISINTAARAIRIRDNGTGVPAADFVKRLSSLGASKKRGRMPAASAELAAWPAWVIVRNSSFGRAHFARTILRDALGLSPLKVGAPLG